MKVPSDGSALCTEMVAARSERVFDLQRTRASLFAYYEPRRRATVTYELDAALAVRTTTADSVTPGRLGGSATGLSANALLLLGLLALRALL